MRSVSSSPMAYDADMKFPMGAWFQFGTLVFVADDGGNLQREEPEEPVITFEFVFGLHNAADRIHDIMKSTIESSGARTEMNLGARSSLMAQVLHNIVSGKKFLASA